MAKWLGILAEHYGKEITPGNAVIYERALSDLTEEQLEQACIQAFQVCRFMPTVADIRGHIKRAELVELKTACDDEWARLIGRIWAWDEYYSNRPAGKAWGSGGPPELSAAGHQAVRLCGGFTAIQQTKPEHLPLLRKTFEEAYHRQIEHAEHLGLDAGESRKLLGTANLGAIVKGMP